MLKVSSKRCDHSFVKWYYAISQSVGDTQIVRAIANNEDDIVGAGGFNGVNRLMAGVAIKFTGHFLMYGFGSGDDNEEKSPVLLCASNLANLYQSYLLDSNGWVGDDAVFNFFAARYIDSNTAADFYS